MVIECSSCHTRFKLADDKIKENGTKVRCTKCREVFTVFPEIPPSQVPPEAPPVIDVAPVSPVAPVVLQQNIDSDALFSASDTSPFDTKLPATSIDIAENKEDDWNQSIESTPFPDDNEDDWDQNLKTDSFSGEFSVKENESDHDTINFDNTETSFFTASSEENDKFDFSGDTEFSFSDLSPASGAEQPAKTFEVSNEKSLTVDSDTDFDVDFFSAAPLPTPTENLTQFNSDVTEEFALNEGENQTDISWSDSDVAIPLEQSKDKSAELQDSSFDLSGFSFDNASFSDRNENSEIAAEHETKIELSQENETEPTPTETRLAAIDTSPTPGARERQESTPRPVRPMRTRPRKKNKNSYRLVVKIIVLIVLALSVSYGFMKRDQLNLLYKNSISRFIESQTSVETSGQIGLVKLSGNYVSNSKEGDLFVIRGEAVNEYKGLRSSIMLKGTLYGDNGVIIQSQSAYCANPLQDDNLKNLGFKEIRDAMSNELGLNLSNLNIPAGNTVPFTIVFNKAPKNIKEFTVEVEGSKPGSK